MQKVEYYSGGNFENRSKIPKFINQEINDGWKVVSMQALNQPNGGGMYVLFEKIENNKPTIVND